MSKEFNSVKLSTDKYKQEGATISQTESSQLITYYLELFRHRLNNLLITPPHYIQLFLKLLSIDRLFNTRKLPKKTHILHKKLYT